MIEALERVHAEYNTAREELDAARHRMRIARQSLILEIEKLRGNLGATPSGRETEVLKLVIEGKSNKEIASELCITPRTVQYHVSNLLDRFDCDNRRQLTAHFSAEGL